MSFHINRNPVATPQSPNIAVPPPDTDTKAGPAPAMNSAHRTALSGRAPQQTGAAAPSPRAAVAVLGAIRTARPDAAQAIADKVFSDVDNGKLALLASHSTVNLKAAISLAARGLIALKNTP
jgi:hypothetical protein